MDSEYWKRIGYTLAVLWGLWCFPLLDLLLALDLKPLWIIFIEGGWGTLDALIWWLLMYYFGVKKEEIKKVIDEMNEVIKDEIEPLNNPIITDDAAIGDYNNGTIK